MEKHRSGAGSRFVSKAAKTPKKGLKAKVHHHRPHSAHHHHHHISWVSAVIAAGIFGLLPLDVMKMELVVAHATKGYEATVNTSAMTVDVPKNGQATVILTYKNTGTLAWKKSGVKDYVSLYLVGKASSPVGCSNWRTPDSPALITDTMVKSGGTTTVKFTVCGKTPGTYTETVRLAAEDTAWMKTSDTLLTIRVSNTVATTPVVTPTTPSTAPATPGTTQPVTSGRVATLLLRSAKDLTLRGSERVKMTLGFKNSGSTIWTSRSLAVAGMFPALVGDPNAQVYDETWPSRGEVVRQDTVTNPGEIGFIDFWMKAPARKGTYRLSLSLQADGQFVEGGLVDIPITVTADGNISSAPVTSPSTPSTPSTPSVPVVVGPDGIPQASNFYSTEPILRVGIFATTDDQMIVTAAAPFRLQQKGSAVCSFNANEQLTLRFDRTNKVYKATGARCQSQSSDFYQVQRTDDPNGPLTMVDFSRPVSWLPGANDNTFRSILELRWSPTTDAVWVINELPIELYLRGIAETSDVSPMEYQKALLTGARTYAMYHWTRATKHASEFFHVDAKYDQVYRGYGAEARSPKIVQAIVDTRGQVVTYDNKLAITPYFSRSDGRTRNWNEVWGGSGYPWLVSVPVPQDDGKTLWGHGVGLSASGALGMAREGSLYQDILKHFYKGISLQRFY